jgi:hypothetical protein
MQEVLTEGTGDQPVPSENIEFLSTNGCQLWQPFLRFDRFVANIFAQHTNGFHSGSFSAICGVCVSARGLRIRVPVTTHWLERRWEDLYSDEL